MRASEDAWSRHGAHAITGFYHEPATHVSLAGPIVHHRRDGSVLQRQGATCTLWRTEVG